MEWKLADMIVKRVFGLAGVVVLLVGSMAATCLAAEVRPLEFVRGLQDKGYHEVAVDYLNSLKKLPEMPQEVAAVWDLEMSKSLRGAAVRVQGFNRQEYERLMAEAQKHLDAFLKNRPDDTQAASALISWGNAAVDRRWGFCAPPGHWPRASRKRGRNLWPRRAALEEARPRFKEAAEKLEALRQTLPVAPPAPMAKRAARQDKASKAAIDQRVRVEGELVNARFQSALVEYYLAQTYGEKAKERQAALERAGQASISFIRLIASRWRTR